MLLFMVQAFQNPPLLFYSGNMSLLYYTVRKRFESFPSPAGMSPKLSLGENNDVITELFLPRGSLVSDIPAGDGKLVNLFYGVLYFHNSVWKYCSIC
jgi:hypothetical protein